jgi:hypothetical protein
MPLRFLRSSPLRPTSCHHQAHTNSGRADILSHPNPTKYPKQKVLVVASDGYAYLVPFVEQADHFFLKTAIPSRKATRDYLHKDDQNAED